MRRIPIRLKMAASLAPMLLVLMAISALEVRRAAGEVAEVRRETQLARAVTGPAGVITRLQDERTWAVVELTGTEIDAVPVAGYDETRAATDEVVGAFRTDVESKGGAVEATFGDALDALSTLGTIRSDIDSDSAPRTIDNMPFSSDIYDGYSELIQGLLDASSRITGQVSDAELRQGTELAILVSTQYELQAALARTTVTTAVLSPGGINTPVEIATISALLSDFDRGNEQILSATGPYAEIVRDHNPHELAEEQSVATETAIGEGTLESFDSYLDILDTPPEESYPGFRDAVFAEVIDRADTLNAEATSRQRLFMILVFVALVLATALTLVVSRSITGPMHSLTRQAGDLAKRRLPSAVRHILETPPGEDVRVPPTAPVKVTTRDEVADVVEALNTVQESALDLAVEQAVLRRNIADSFVSMGRRNQNLLSRQLDFITELEANETDPDTLAGLFRLDHLATRMRRNAESLLVLAGVSPARKWTAPVRLTDVIRAALGEVENYQRVTIDANLEPAMILGLVTADLTHLLAELIENALTYSPPTDPVVVRGRWRDGRDRRDGYRLTIVDEGFGMPAADMAHANARLAGSESMMVAPSKYLGHHVAGSLAARHGIHIQLEPAPVWGIIATVDLPPEVVDGPVTQPTQQDPAGFLPSLTAAPVAGLAAAPDERDPKAPEER